MSTLKQCNSSFPMTIFSHQKETVLLLQLFHLEGVAPEVGPNAAQPSIGRGRGRGRLLGHGK